MGPKKEGKVNWPFGKFAKKLEKDYPPNFPEKKRSFDKKGPLKIGKKGGKLPGEPPN